MACPKDGSLRWLFEPRSQTVSNTGSFLKFESVGTLDSSFDYRGRCPLPSPSWWSAGATPAVTLYDFGVLVAATTDESHRTQNRNHARCCVPRPAHGLLSKCLKAPVVPCGPTSSNSWDHDPRGCYPPIIMGGHFLALFPFSAKMAVL